MTKRAGVQRLPLTQSELRRSEIIGLNLSVKKTGWFRAYEFEFIVEPESESLRVTFSLNGSRIKESL